MPTPPTSSPKRLGGRTLQSLVGVTVAASICATIGMWEGRKYVPYRDIIGVWTVCDGDTKDVAAGVRQTEEQCNARLDRQAVAHVEPVLACVPALRDRPNQLVASASLAYNIGPTAFCKSSVARRFNAGNWRGGCDAFLMWNKAGGRVVKGLDNRRRYERDLCLKRIETWPKLSYSPVA